MLVLSSKEKVVNIKELKTLHTVVEKLTENVKEKLVKENVNLFLQEEF